MVSLSPKETPPFSKSRWWHFHSYSPGLEVKADLAALEMDVKHPFLCRRVKRTEPLSAGGRQIREGESISRWNIWSDKLSRRLNRILLL